jgi:hypothetical protein
MAHEPLEETTEQAVNPTAILQARQAAIAQGLRARHEAPQELPPELGRVLINRFVRGTLAMSAHALRTQLGTCTWRSKYLMRFMRLPWSWSDLLMLEGG